MESSYIHSIGAPFAEAAPKTERVEYTPAASHWQEQSGPPMTEARDHRVTSTMPYSFNVQTRPTAPPSSY